MPPADAGLEADEFPGLTIVARQAMDKAREGLPKDVGLALFAFHYGPGDYTGGLAYVGMTDRPAMISVVVEWLAHQCDQGRGEEVWAAFERWFGKKEE